MKKTLTECPSKVEPPTRTTEYEWCRTNQICSCLPIDREDSLQLTKVWVVVKCTGHGEDYWEGMVRVHYYQKSAEQHAERLNAKLNQMIGRYQLVSEGLAKWEEKNPKPKMQYTVKDNCKLTARCERALNKWWENNKAETARLYALHKVDIDFNWKDSYGETKYEVRKVESEIDYRNNR